MKHVGWVPVRIGNKTKRNPDGTPHAMAFRLYAKPHKDESEEVFEAYHGKCISEYPDIVMRKVYIAEADDGQ